MRVKHSRLFEDVNGFKVNYNDFINTDSGVCISVFMNGCPHHCKECFNQELWNYTNAVMDDKTCNTITSHIFDNDISRQLSILGGEPLCDENINNTFNIIKAYKEKNPNGKIYVWSGYTYNELKNKDNKNLKYILNSIDKLIDGKFMIDKKIYKLPLRGSSNQKIINLKEMR